jgi:capsid portal protein
MNPTTGKVDMTLTPETAANEIIQFKNYTPRSSYYGLPDIIPAVPSISGGISARDYNLRFFDHNAVPDYAVIIDGGEMTPALKALVQDYFSRDVVGRRRKTLILENPDPNVKITLQPLGVDVRDASFRLFRIDVRDEVLVAHGMPPARVGVIETANLGSGSGLSQASTYKNAIVEPRQQRMETRIDKLIIEQGFGIKDWMFRFVDIDIEDRLATREIVVGLLPLGVVSINESRGWMALPPIAGGDRPFVLSTTGEIIFIEELEEMARSRNLTKSADLPPEKRRQCRNSHSQYVCHGDGYLA